MRAENVSIFIAALLLLFLPLTEAGNKERNLWAAILTNNMEDIILLLYNGANPNSRNEVSGHADILCRI